MKEHLLRRDSRGGVEFPLLWFETCEAVGTFDREAAIVAEATHLVARSDRVPQHYRIIAPD